MTHHLIQSFVFCLFFLLLLLLLVWVVVSALVVNEISLDIDYDLSFYSSLVLIFLDEVIQEIYLMK